MPVEKELPRRLFHILGGLSLPVAALLSPQDIFLPTLTIVTLAFLLFEILRLSIPSLNRRFLARFRTLLRDKETSTLTSSSYLLAAAAIVFTLCHYVTAIMALAFLAVGDPTAGIVGQRWRKPGLRGKSLIGSAACLASCMAAGAGIALLTHTPPWLALIGALCATITELLSLPPNDNFTIPLLSAGVMSIVLSLVIQ